MTTQLTLTQGRRAALGAVAIAVILTLGIGAAYAQNKCLAGKIKCVNKKMASLLKCHEKAERKGVTVDQACLAKGVAKFDGGTKGIAYSCFGKLEAKNEGPCVTFGDLAAQEAKVDAFVADVVTELDPSYPSPILNLCSARKKKCVLKKAAGKLKCHEKCQKDPGKCGDALTRCLEKATDKFDGGAKGIAYSCFGKLEAKGGCVTTGDMATLEAKVDAFVLDVRSELGYTPTGCPGTVAFAFGDAADDMDLGWTGMAHDQTLPAMSRLTLNVDSCSGSFPTCGTCDLSGPIADAAFSSQRCTNNTAIECTDDAPCFRQCVGGTYHGRECLLPGDCPDGFCVVAGTCEFFLTAPQPIWAGGLSTCVTNEIASAVTGTVDIAAGEVALTGVLNRSVYWLLTVDQPCPRCVGDPTPNDGVRGGTCSTYAGYMGYSHEGRPCDVHGSSHNPYGGSTSFDCPPDLRYDLGSGVSSLLNLTTGTQIRSLSAASPKCRAPESMSLNCLCDTCDNAEATPCGSNADCVAVGATLCGSGAGTTTRPNACVDGVCHPTTGDEGECSAGPFEFLCGPTATFAGCIGDEDCGRFNRCAGGSNDGWLGCAGDSECPGGSCEIQTCSIMKSRECFTDNGVIGPHCFGGANDGATCGAASECPSGFCGGGSVTATGEADTPVAGVAQPVLGAFSCHGVLATYAPNIVAGYPGLARMIVPVTMSLD
jgi:hypothetical protein